MAEDLNKETNIDPSEDDVETLKSEVTRLQNLVDRYSKESQTHRKGKSDATKELDSIRDKFDRVLSALNLDAEDEEFDDRLAELASAKEESGNKGKGSDEDAEKRGYQKAKMEYSKQIKDMQRDLEDLKDAKQRADSLQVEINNGKINRAIRTLGLEKGVDPKRVDRFVKNVRLDFEKFDIDEHGEILYRGDGNDDFATVEAITDKFLGTEDGKMFVPQNVKPGLGSQAGGSGPSKPITRESIDMQRAIKDEAYRQEIYDKLNT